MFDFCNLALFKAFNNTYCKTTYNSCQLISRHCYSIIEMELLEVWVENDLGSVCQHIKMKKLNNIYSLHKRWDLEIAIIPSNFLLCVWKLSNRFWLCNIQPLKRLFYCCAHSKRSLNRHVSFASSASTQDGGLYIPSKR